MRAGRRAGAARIRYIAGMIAKLSSPFREFGAVAGIAYLADRLLNAVSDRTRLYVYELMEQPVRGPGLLAERKLAPFELKRIDGDADELALLPVPPEVVDFRLSQDAVCLGTYRAGELVGYIWFCFGEYRDDEVRVSYRLPDAGSVFDFDVYVMSRHRLGVAFAATWELANRFLREQGIRRSYSRVSRFNPGSRRAHARLGAVSIGKAAVLKLGRFQLLCATVPPYLHAGIGTAGALRLAPAPRPAGPDDS